MAWAEIIRAIGEYWPPLAILSSLWIGPLVFVIWSMFRMQGSMFRLQEAESRLNRDALDRNTKVLGDLKVAIAEWRR